MKKAPANEDSNNWYFLRNSKKISNAQQNAQNSRREVNKFSVLNEIDLSDENSSNSNVQIHQN